MDPVHTEISLVGFSVKLMKDASGTCRIGIFADELPEPLLVLLFRADLLLDLFLVMNQPTVKDTWEPPLPSAN